MSEPSKVTVLRYGELPAVGRGEGVVTNMLAGDRSGAERFISGLTTLQPGAGVPRHLHNCDEQVTILAGQAELERENGDVTRLGPFDTTLIEAGVWHRFANAGGEPLTILWVYGARDVTRTFAHNGKTVKHLSAGDVTDA